MNYYFLLFKRYPLRNSRFQVMLYDQIIVSTGEDVGVLGIESQTEYVAGMLLVHGSGLSQFGHHLAVDVPQQNPLVVAP